MGDKRTEDMLLGTKVAEEWREDTLDMGPFVSTIPAETLGALVRLVRTMTEKYADKFYDGDDIAPDIIAWLSEARALVGEVNDADT